MDIKSIKTFVRAAELESFTAAAKELCYVQSTVTVQIKQLEKELGFPLFDRIGKKISLTAAGREFLEVAYEMLHSAKKAESIGKNHQELHGVLRIGVSESLLFTVIMNILPAFKERFQNIEVNIITGHSVELTEQLKANQLDMVYIAQPPVGCFDLLSLYSRPEEFIFVCAPSHPAAKGKISVPELMKHKFIVTERSGICYGMLSELAMRYGTAPNISVEVDSVYIITKLAEKGMGIAFLPKYSVKEGMNSGLLREISVDAEKQVYLCHLLTHKNRWISPAMAEFVNMINTVRPGENQ